MQFRINLLGGVKCRQEFTGTTFVLSEIGKAKQIDVSIEVVGLSQEEIRGVKKGLSVKTSSSFTGATFYSDEDTTIEVIVSRNDLQINYLDGSLINANVINTVKVTNNETTMFVTQLSNDKSVINSQVINISENSTQLTEFKIDRLSIRITNRGTEDIAIGPLNMPWDSRTIVLHPNDTWVEDNGPRLAWAAICEPGKQSKATIQEVNWL